MVFWKSCLGMDTLLKWSIHKLVMQIALEKDPQNHFNMPTHHIFCTWHVSEENYFREFKNFIDTIFHTPLSVKLYETQGKMLQKPSKVIP